MKNLLAAWDTGAWPKSVLGEILTSPLRFLYVLAMLLLLTATLALAQGGHSVSLSWVLSTDDTTAGCAAPNTCSQTVYRASGACSTSSNFVSIGTPAASISTFTDSTVVPGTYCYAVSFTQNGLESSKDTVTVKLDEKDKANVRASLELGKVEVLDEAMMTKR